MTQPAERALLDYVRRLELRVAALERREQSSGGGSWPGFDDSGSPADVAGAAADGVSAYPARNDHAHTIGAGVVTSTMLADGAVLAEILDDDGPGSGLDADLLDGQHEAALLRADGSRALTGDWDIGASRKVAGDKVAARSASGLRVEDDGGNLGLFVKDGGFVGVGTNSPASPLSVLAASDGSIASFGVNDGSDDVGFNFYGYTSDYGTAYMQDSIMFYASSATSILQLTAAKTGGQIRFNTDGFNSQTYERMRIEAAGVGISAGGNTFAPQGPLHVHDGTGGFLVVSKSGITGTAKTLIPDGSGDVTKLVRLSAITHNGTTVNYTAFSLDIGGTTTQNVTISSDTYQYRLNANGSLDVRRTAGSNNGTCHVTAQWI